MGRKDNHHDQELAFITRELPPTPPDSEDNASDLNDDVNFPLPPPSIQPQVLDIDKKTPDHHVPRDPRLIRLTGVHPFNVEPPLSDLFNQGFLTPPELWYVRNHGAVPEVRDEDIPDWEFSVEGMVEKPLKLTLKQLISEFEQVTYPVTMVCAGNRRKEQNMVRKSKGFSWGAAGLSTALFTGVAMSDVIRRAKPSRRAKYVCMEGADKLPNGFYGTSVKMNWVMDPNRGITLSYKMNGEMLRPDHGKPLRAVVPGQIGGRSVKWLKKLIVTEEPSTNWYHIYDNRVLPTMVSPDESSKDPNWWRDDRYAIYDLSVNSAIAYPAHDEQLNLTNAEDSYRMQGYAYGGGGRRITRVELSLDQGRSWRLANIQYPEDLYRETEQRLFGGRLDLVWREACFCWCFWSLEIPTGQLVGAKDILVRAMDESMNLQPRDMYWSVLGMMNNPWFRVAILREGDNLRFEHPTQPALMPGGWMERAKKAGGDLTNGFWGENIDGDESTAPEGEPVADVRMTKDGMNRIITLEELRQHEGEEQPWFVLNGEVYDGTGFLKDHPGGAQSIISAACQDATDEFMAIHSETAKAMMPDYHIGRLEESALKILRDGEDDTQANGTVEKRPTFLNPRSWKKAVLTEKKTVSWDTRIFTYKLEHPDQTLGLPVGQHLMVRMRDPSTGEAIIRSYTPISETNKKGYLEMLVKIYFDTKETRGGKMTKAMDALPVGQTVDLKGPIGKFEYLGGGKCAINGVVRKVKSFCMICGGSGITPIFQVLRAVMQDPNDHTRCVVFNGNRLVEDILCREELDAFQSANSNKCKLLYTLTKAPEHWTGLRGRLSGELIKKHVRNDGETMALICGPESMEVSIHAALLQQGWKEDDILRF